MDRRRLLVGGRSGVGGRVVAYCTRRAAGARRAGRRPWIALVLAGAAWLTGCDTVGRFANPVLAADHPDPFVLRSSDGFIAFATNGGGHHVQTATSRDLVVWERGSDALPDLPPWAVAGRTWAPEVMRVDDRYLLYFTARHARLGIQCIGVAVADRAPGPYASTAGEPIVCQEEEAGSIDPSPLQAPDGRRYLFWKSDGNARGLPTWLYGQPLAADGLSLLGEPRRLLRDDAAWEAGLIEAPHVAVDGDTYYLFFSGSGYAGAGYAVGYATATSPLGPYVKAAHNPILATAEAAVGPGHVAVLRDDAGAAWLVYHAWSAGAVGRRGDPRSMRLDRLELDTDGSVRRVVPSGAFRSAPRIR